MTNRLLHVSCLVLVLALLAGCKSKGPVPGEGSPSGGVAPQVGAAETTGAHPGAANPHAGGDPHAGMAMNTHGAGSVAPEVDSKGMLDVGSVAFKVPDAWQVQPPKSSMRRAQLAANGKEGPAELIVFYFGPQGAGSAQDNIDRWVGQFKNADGSPVTEPSITKGEANGLQFTRVEAAGQYSNTMAQPGQAAPAVSNQRLIAAIVESKGGPYYFKFVGPEATVTEQRQAIDALLASIVASE